MNHDLEMKNARRAFVIFVVVAIVGVVLLISGCGDPCSSNPAGPGCPCLEHTDCAGWCTTDGCQPGTKQGDWTPCLYEEARSCDEVCADTGQSCANACGWPFAAVAFSQEALACTDSSAPDWMGPWESAIEVEGLPACQAAGVDPYRSCCCLPEAP